MVVVVDGIVALVVDGVVVSTIEVVATDVSVVVVWAGMVVGLGPVVDGTVCCARIDVVVDESNVGAAVVVVVSKGCADSLVVGAFRVIVVDAKGVADAVATGGGRSPRTISISSAASATPARAYSPTFIRLAVGSHRHHTRSCRRRRPASPSLG